MKRVFPLSTVRQAVRARVCGRCPQRSGDDPRGCDHARACESTCPLFRHLPKLWDLAVRLDPMVANVAPALRRAVLDADPPAHPVAPGRVGRDRAFVCILRDLSGK